MSDRSLFVDLDLPGVPGAQPSHRVPYRFIEPDAPDADASPTPLLVFLHEGLGSIAMWRDFPDRVCAQLQCRGLVYSRYGYGEATPRPHTERWGNDYLQHHALHVLPALYAALGIEPERDRPILFGHSDGGSIALIQAAHRPDQVAGVVVAAPHVMVEDITIEGIQGARQAYLQTDLPKKLARYHTDVDSAFWAWNDAWLAPSFRAFDIRSELAAITCPVIALQGIDDEYGTLEQIDAIGRHVPHAVVHPLPQCGHSPHRDQPIAVINAIAQVLAQVSIHSNAQT